MRFHFPVRRFLQSTVETATPKTRVGALQWVLTRPLYRFQTFDLAQVPPKNRTQALRLELTQWTPFSNSGYYIGWRGKQALVWGWDADKVNQTIVAQGLKPRQVTVLPESALQTPAADGLCVTQCAEGFEAQCWRDGQLERSRWLAQMPTPEDWLMFQRDVGTLPNEQQARPPAPRPPQLNENPWLRQVDLSSDASTHWEPLAFAFGSLLLLLPTLWFGFAMLKMQLSTSQLRGQLAQLEQQAIPILQARGQALDHLARARTLMALDTYPRQLSLMAKVADLLPNDKSYLKGWDFQQGQLKITVAASNDISTTFLIGALQQAGPFQEVKALPGRDPKSVTFEMKAVAQ